MQWTISALMREQSHEGELNNSELTCPWHGANGILKQEV